MENELLFEHRAIYIQNNYYCNSNDDFNCNHVTHTFNRYNNCYL